MRFRNPFDKTDIIAIVGLLLLGGGIAFKKPWLAACVVGMIIVIISIIRATRS